MAGRSRLSIGKRGRDEWDEGADGAPPPCPLAQQPAPMEDREKYQQMQRACRDGVDARTSWTVEQLSCLWAELDMLLAEVGERRAQLHGERAALTVWMALSMLTSPQAVQDLDEEEAVGGARTRSSAIGTGLDGLGLTRQMSEPLVPLKPPGARDRHGRFLKSDLERAGGQFDAEGGGCTGKSREPPASYEYEGEAAGYEIRRVSAEADPEALWHFVDAYFDPVSEAAADVLHAEARVRRFCAEEMDACDPFELRPRGRHYLEQWDEEAQLLVLALAHSGVAPPPPFTPGTAEAAGAAVGKLHWQLELEAHNYSARVLAALVDKPGFIPRIDIAPTRAGAVDSLSLPTQPAVMCVAAEADSRQQSAALEEELRAELVRLGLIDGLDAKLADEDDPLCAELRQVQGELRATVAQNESLCHKGRERLGRFVDAQRVEERRQAETDEVTEQWRVVMKRLKLERKAERKRKKLSNLRGNKLGNPTAPKPPATAAEQQAPAADVAAGGVAAESVVAVEPKEEGGSGGGGSNDESTEDEREEEPGPGWGAAAPQIVGAVGVSPGRAKAAKRTTRQSSTTAAGAQ
ncbi:hypothetical protein T492DRAFT_1049611 [Pavlovales sp. CCMP2436]|nr:hypothetical protein T492DRAFT_1049611 [Pavlovales sp. CCMP2436]